MIKFVRFFIRLIPIRKLRHGARRKLGYNFRGKNNTVIYKGKEYASCIEGLDIEIDGNGHRVIIDDTATFQQSKILLSGNNSTLCFGKNCQLRFVDIRLQIGDNQKVEIGDGVTTNGVGIFSAEKNSHIIIGNDCMFSWGIEIWGGDGHPIFDTVSGRRINSFTQPLRIGDHTWIGKGAVIHKNARIPPNTIVAHSAVVTRKFCDEFTVIAGNPARVVKENVRWERDNISN